MSAPALAGYTLGHAPTSPVTSPDLDQLLASALFDDADRTALRRAGALLDDQIEDLLDVWYGFVGSQPHLLAHFATPDGQPIDDYLARVRGRFGQWVRDTCAAEYGQAWVDYQHEIGRRHARAAKNTTDGADSTAYVPWRHLIALVAPITLTVRPFLAQRATPEDDVEAMMAAWLKAVVIQVALWSMPYVADGQW